VDLRIGNLRWRRSASEPPRQTAGDRFSADGFRVGRTKHAHKVIPYDLFTCRLVSSSRDRVPVGISEPKGGKRKTISTMASLWRQACTSMNTIPFGRDLQQNRNGSMVYDDEYRLQAL
jgi:hypothetical protein